MVRTSKTNPDSASDNYNEYVKELEAKLAMYESKNADELNEEITVNQTDYIKVMSLLPYSLNLCTRERGQGKVYRFSKLFQVKRVIYSDLIDILEVNRQFLEDGYFIILSPKVVRLNGLDDVQSSILTKEKIEEILNGSDESLAVYSSANKRQQEVIVEMITDKLVNEPNGIDLNLVDRLSRLSGVNISQKAEDLRELLKPVSEETK
jgi:hypothetical protein